MKSSFVFSRRFWVPFLLTLAAHLFWFGRELGKGYYSDFTGKGLPSYFFYKWVWLQVSGTVLFVGFLAAFVTAIAWYSHYKTRTDKAGFRPFSSRNLFLVSLFMTAGFFWTSFAGPAQYAKSLKMVSAVVFAKNYEEYKKYMMAPADFQSPNVKAMTLQELLTRKRFLQQRYMDEYDASGFKFPVKDSLQKVKYEIAKKFIAPLLVLLFYFAGVFMGYSFHKAHILFPFFLSWVCIALGWFIADLLCSRWYYRQQLNLFGAATLPSLLLIAALLLWYWALRQYGFFKKQQDALPDDFLQEHNE